MVMGIISALKRIYKPPFEPLYNEAGLSQSIRRGLSFLIFGNLCGNIFFAVTGGPALIGYASALGANDFVFGILTAIPLIGTLMQLPASIIVSRSGKRRKYMLTFGLAGRAMWIVIGLVPYFIPMDPNWLRLWSVVLLAGASSVNMSFVNVCFTPWFADLVPLQIRGRWISSRDRIISAACIAVGMLTAMVLDYIPGYPGYAIVFIFGGLIGALDMLTFLKVEETPVKTSANARIMPVLRQIARNREFFPFMMFWTVWSFATSLIGPFTGRYALEYMDLTFIELNLAGQVANSLIVVFVISKWGRVIDRYGSKPVMLITCFMMSFSPLILLFATPRNVAVYLIFSLFWPAFWCAANLCSMNMQLSCSPDGQRPTYIAIFSIITSLGGVFPGVLLGGAVLEWLPGFLRSMDITVAGRAPDHYKIIFAVSVALRLPTVLLLAPRLKNDQNASLADLIRDAKKWGEYRWRLFFLRRRR